MKKIKPLSQDLSISAHSPNHGTKLANKFGKPGSILHQLIEFASSVVDFRRLDRGNIRHSLRDILMLMLLARMSGCVGRADIIEFGRRNLNKFRKMGMLRNGVPSEATLCRADKGINDSAMADGMRKFAEAFRKEVVEAADMADIICIDGKAMCGTVLENGRNPDIVSAYSTKAGITLATEACREKSNEITAGPALLDKIDISGDIITADAMLMQKQIIDKIREKNADFVIELKANQRALRFWVEDKLKFQSPVQQYTEGPVLAHGRIETRTYRIYDGLELVKDKDKWGDNLTVIEFSAQTTKKSTRNTTCETRLYVSSLRTDTPLLGSMIRAHWRIEIMHWELDRNLQQDRIKRKTPREARNLDTLQRIVLSVFSVWRNRRKKRSDKAKGMAELMRYVSGSFTRLIHFLSQK